MTHPAVFEGSVAKSTPKVLIRRDLLANFWARNVDERDSPAASVESEPNAVPAPAADDDGVDLDRVARARVFDPCRRIGPPDPSGGCADSDPTARRGTAGKAERLEPAVRSASAEAREPPQWWAEPGTKGPWGSQLTTGAQWTDQAVGLDRGQGAAKAEPAYATLADDPAVVALCGNGRRSDHDKAEREDRDSPRAAQSTMSQ
jgi:hypothetical protein